MPIPELVDGWQRFRRGRFREQRELFERNAREGQRPRIAMVACCDSRVDPAIVFDCNPGDLFLVRNVANLVPPHEESGAYHGTSAAIEFAVGVLAVEHLVVLGHTQCGGIRALLEGVPKVDPPMRFLEPWMSLAQEARTRALATPGLDDADRATLCERLAIGLSVRNLRTFPSIVGRVRAGTLRLHGWHFDLGHGQLAILDEARGTFAQVGAPEA